MTPQLPQPINRNSNPFVISDPGWWLVLSDIHIPYHDPTTVELAIEEATKNKVKGVLLNGDVMDYHELSRFDKSPDDPRYRDEVLMGWEFLAYLRYRLPRVKIVWKEGNHEERLWLYLIQRAPALFGLDVVTTANIMKLSKHRVTYVGERRVIQLGKLNVVHGHEYRPGIQAPVNPARGLFLRAKSVALCGHFHQTSEHNEKDITGKAQAAWSVGCACGLMPFYMPLNKHNHGFALVRVASDGNFEVRNLRVLNGKVV